MVNETVIVKFPFLSWINSVRNLVQN